MLDSARIYEKNFTLLKEGSGRPIRGRALEKGKPMSDLQQRIEALYRSDLRGSALLIICLWATILFVLVMTWPYIPDTGIKIVVAIAAAAVLIFNTAAILAMVNHYKEDKDFIYGLDIKNADAARNRKS
ncbi:MULTISPECIES: hypothetical protein [unclassified Mesorhizobium]|uniref:hypothetical protein n=2 Tax=unclassified Mesorhizobium TaxID=325217 RepID=UPI001FD9BB33|nr:MULTISPECIES: hypothetical protein [unclassified Mesorhizobium]